MKEVNILDFDIENRPLAYLGQDYTTAEITAIAACWHGKPASMVVWLLGRDEPQKMLEEFLWWYNAADMVTGHYIRRHDLPIVNGAMMEYGLGPLPEKLVCDTKTDLLAHHQLSASQENLCEMLSIKETKIHMSNAKWREANRLTMKGMHLTEKRVVGDIKQHMALRNVLVKRNMLKPPTVWRP